MEVLGMEVSGIAVLDMEVLGIEALGIEALGTEESGIKVFGMEVSAMEIFGMEVIATFYKRHEQHFKKRKIQRCKNWYRHELLKRKQKTSEKDDPLPGFRPCLFWHGEAELDQV